MSPRAWGVVAAAAVLVVYGTLYLCGWWFLWQVPVVERDGMEWGPLFLLTLPWSLLAGTSAGWLAVHAGAAINASVIATFAGLKVSRRERTHG